MLRKIALLVLFSCCTAFSLYKEGEVLVKFKEGVSSKSIQSKAANILSIEPLFETTYKVRFSKGKVEDMMATLQSDPDVVYAEPNYIRHICGTPNDTYFSSEWGLPKIQAPLAWDIGTGAGFVKIAIIDTGVDIDHPDLVEKIISGGYDFANDDSNPDDDQGHGTHVAGIAAASTNNWIGVAGVAWGCKILAIKVLDSGGYGTDDNCALGIRYAADNGARVINMSWGGKTPPAFTLEDACNYAYNKGCLLVAAAGNNTPSTPIPFICYPAAYENVLAVAATDFNDNRASFSNYGDWVDVAAPGQDIYSTTRNNSYGSMDGTSMATPFVSGLAGLLFSGSGSLTNVQAAEIIKATADAISQDHPIGTGRINAYNAIRQVRFPETKTWTFMVYLDGDNNLEEAAIDDFLEMAQVGSTDTVNIVVQFDRISGYNTGHGNWTGTKRFYITKGMTPISGSATMSIGEANMGDPQTLIDFVQWAKLSYPADHYALVLWNHGGGWRSKGVSTKAVCEDDTDDDCLYMKEVSSALAQVAPIDLIGFDACLMAMVEVAYQIQDFGDVMVGSEEVEPNDGWPYDTILTELVGSPTMTAKSLGRIIVQKYGLSYLGDSDITQSAIDLKQMGSFTQSINSFVNNIWGRWDEIRQKRVITDSVSDSDYPYADIFHFSQLMVATLTVNPIISNYHSNNHPNLQGLTIYFPETDDDSEYEDYTADNISFPAHCQWDEFLKALLTQMVGIFISPIIETVTIDESIPYTAIAINGHGEKWDITQQTSFVADDPNARFSGNIYYPGMVGTWRITATYGTFTAQATVTVKEGRMMAYPNPYSPNKGHKRIIFKGLPKDSHVQIRNIAGELVKEIVEKEREAIWEHPEVASGVYIYLIQSPGGKKDIGKIGIVK
ncbi:MAG: S8 family serine peptidase [bacterium]